MADPNATTTKDCLSAAVIDGAKAGVQALVIAGALYGLAWRCVGWLPWPGLDGAWRGFDVACQGCGGEGSVRS